MTSCLQAVLVEETALGTAQDNILVSVIVFLRLIVRVRCTRAHGVACRVSKIFSG